MKRMIKTASLTAALAAALGTAVPAPAQTIFGGSARAGAAGGASAAAWRLNLPVMTTSLGLGSSPSPSLIGSLAGLLAGTPLTPAGFDMAPSVQIKAQVEGALVARTLPILKAGAEAAARERPGSEAFDRAFEDVLDLRAVAHLLPDEQFVLISRKGAEIEKLLLARHEGKSAEAVAKAKAIAAELSAPAKPKEDGGAVGSDMLRDPKKGRFLARFALKPAPAGAASKDHPGYFSADPDLEAELRKPSLPPALPPSMIPTPSMPPPLAAYGGMIPGGSK